MMGSCCRRYGVGRAAGEGQDGGLSRRASSAIVRENLVIRVSPQKPWGLWRYMAGISHLWLEEPLRWYDCATAVARP